MRHETGWRPTKYRVEDGRLSHSTDSRELAPSSRLAAALVADFYNRNLPMFASGDLLDLGCGKQPLYGAYEPHTRWVVAVDWPSSLHASPHLDAYCDLTRPLPFRDSSFDTVLSSDVLEHVPDPRLMFREVGRVLRAGGVLLLNTPFLYPVHEAPHDYLRHTRFSLARLAEEAGLEVVAVEEVGGAVEVLADIVGKLLGRVPGVGARLAAAVQGLAVRLRHGRLLSRARRLSSPYFPLAHGLVARKPGRA